MRKSENPRKKYDAVFDDGRVVSFGAIHPDGRPYIDYTTGATDSQRERYLARHRHREDWDDPYSPGALSARILWGESRSLQANLNAYRKRFRL